MTALPAPRRFDGVSVSAATYDHGAHIVEWTPSGQAPVLWMSAHSALDTGAPIRGGVPICFPWFGAGRAGTSTPAHGFARLSQWQLLDVVESATGVVVTYALDREPSPEFPHNLHAELVADFGSELSLEFSVTNFGSEVLEFEEALHTYLKVGDIRRISISGLEGAPYIDKAPGGGDARQVGDITFSGETDRVYQSTGEVVIVDPVLERRITVSRTHSANVVVWNPWVAKSAAMADFGDDEWPGMVCVEGANVLDNAVRLAPGDTHCMGYRLQVEALA